MSKDLKILPKDRKDEILAARSYLDQIDENGTTKSTSLIIDKTLPDRISSAASASVSESAGASAARESEEQRQSKEPDDEPMEMDEEDISAIVNDES